MPVHRLSSGKGPHGQRWVAVAIINGDPSLSAVSETEVRIEDACDFSEIATAIAFDDQTTVAELEQQAWKQARERSADS